MIRVSLKGYGDPNDTGFGNHLFQISIGNALAIKHDRSVWITPERSNSKNSSDYCKRIQKFKDISLQRHTSDDKKPRDDQKIINDKNINEAFECKLDKNRGILIEGYFQNEYCIDKFKEYNTYHPMGQQINACYIHVRWFKQPHLLSKLQLPYEYYEQAILNRSCETIMLSSNDISNPICGKIIKNNKCVEIISDNPIDTVMTAARCKEKILSFGTFSWWTGFLGDLWYEDCSVTHSGDTSKIFHGNIFIMDKWKSI